MRAKFSILQRIENDRPITAATDGAFLRRLRESLLLALGEKGLLNDAQLQRALNNR